MHWLLHTSDTSGLPLLLASAGLTKFDFNRFAKDDGGEVGIDLKVVVKKNYLDSPSVSTVVTSLKLTESSIEDPHLNSNVAMRPNLILVKITWISSR